LCQEFNELEKSCDKINNIHLDEISIKKNDFLAIFYPHGENFGINKTIINDHSYIPYISFDHQIRTLNKKPFYLLDKIIENIESDLQMSRDCFTTNSFMEMTHEFTKIKTICDLNCCSVVSSLPWSIVEDILENSKKASSIVFIVSIMFKTPTPGVKDNIIKFSYLITDL
jgi:hypothetical protein